MSIYNGQRSVMLPQSPSGNHADGGDTPAIFDPQFIGVSEADSFCHEDEPLMVVSSLGETKQYSIWYLDRYEIVNDYINGAAITVTW